MEMKKARTPGRSARAHICEMELVSCTMVGDWANAHVLQGNANGIEDVAQHGLGRLRFLLQRSVARAGGDAMRKNRDCQRFKIVGDAVIAAVEKRASLGCALEH